MSIIPTPFINPEITGYGTYLTKLTDFVNDSINWKIPLKIKTAKIRFGFPAYKETAAVKTITLGPVGPETSGNLQPNKKTTEDKIIAPQSPAEAPSPVATPKASA